MVDDALHRFIKLKEDVAENLDALVITLENCKDMGMHDYESALYNQISDLEEELDNTEDELELSEIIVHAKVAERKIDTWLSSQGKSSMSLSWPNI